MEHAVEKQRITLAVWVIAIVAAFTGVLFGFGTANLASAMLFIVQQFHIGHTTNGMLMGSILVGAFVACLFSGRLTDVIGRKKAMFATALLFIIGSIVAGKATNITGLFIGRVITGFGVGIGSYAAPMYLSEVSPIHLRGMIVSLNQLAVTIGILLAYFVGRVFEPTANWSMILMLGALPGAVLFLGVVILPESPQWLFLKGMKEKGIAALKRIRHPKDNLDAEIKLLSKPQEKAAGGNTKELFAKWVRPALVVGLSLAVIQQITGINIIIYYAPTIFQMAGALNAKLALMSSLIIGIVNVAATIFALPLIDRLGRRALLLIGVAGMFLSLLYLGYAFSPDHVLHGTTLVVLTLSSLIVYIISFAISLGPIVWLLISEVYPLHIRGFAMSISVAANWLANIIVTVTFMTLIGYLGKSHTFWFYASMCLLSFLFIYYFVPETKGCSLSQIEANLRDGKSARQMGK